MKFLVSILFLLMCSYVSAKETPISPDSDIQVNQLNENKLKIEKQVIDLNEDLESLRSLHLGLSLSIEKNLNYQKNLQESVTKLLEKIVTAKEQLPSLKVRLLQPTNLYVFALPIVTIFIVLGGAFLSLRTIKIKSQESLDALEASNKNQLDISKRNNESERLKSQESIISNSRQKWINSLRDELSSLLSHLTQYSIAPPERQSHIFSKIWEELFKIELLLNPNEDLHKQLIKDINIAFTLCAIKEEQDKYRVQRDKVLSISKEILKLEWRRVKSFD